MKNLLSNAAAKVIADAFSAVVTFIFARGAAQFLRRASIAAAVGTGTTLAAVQMPLPDYSEIAMKVQPWVPFDLNWAPSCQVKIIFSCDVL